MAQYESYALGPKFDPPTPVENTTKARKQYQQELSQLQDFFNQNRVVDQQRIEDARFAGQDLKALAPFVKSFGETAQAFKKKANEDIIIGQYVESAMREDPRISAVEGQTYEFGSQAQGASKLFNGIANEQAFLTDVAATLDSQVNGLLQSNYMVNYNGQQIPLFQLAQSPATAALATNFALQQVYKNRGVQFATKKGFVEILKPMHRQVLSNRTSNLITQANAVQQRTNQATLKQESSASAARLTLLAEDGQLSDEEVETTFLNLADKARKINTGLSASEVNVSILQAMLATPERNSALNTKLQNARLRAGGQRLGDLYPKAFADDKKRIDKNIEAYDQERATDLAQQRRKEIENFLDAGGTLDEAREMRKAAYREISDIDPTVAGNFDNGAARLISDTGDEIYENFAQAIVEGDGNITEEVIRRSDLKASQQDALISRLNTRKEVNDLVGTDVRSKLDTLEKRAKEGAGFKLDKEGRYTIPSGWFEGGNVAPIENAVTNMRNDLFRELNVYARSSAYRNLPNEEARRVALEKKRDELYDDYISLGGKYQGLGMLIGGNTANKDVQQLITDEMRKHADSSNIGFTSSKSASASYEAYWNPGMPVSEQLRKAYSDGKATTGVIRILTYNELEAYGNEYNDTGEWSPAFKELAKGLGVHPKDLWMQQSKSIKTPADVDSRIKLNVKVEPAQPEGITPGPNITEAEAKSLGYATSQWLQNTGMSENAGFTAWPYFVYTPKREWEAMVKDRKADSGLWSILTSPYRTKRQNTTALHNWFANRNQQ